MDQDEAKYAKRRRKNRSRRMMSWPMFGTVSACLLFILAASIANDHFALERRRNRKSAVKRAREIMLQRQQGIGGQARSKSNGNENADTNTDTTHLRKKQDSENVYPAEGLMKRMFGGGHGEPSEELRQLYHDLNRDIEQNRAGGIRWIQDKLLKELPDHPINKLLDRMPSARTNGQFRGDGKIDFGIRRKGTPPMKWEDEWKHMTENMKNTPPKVDFTNHSYEYPKVEKTPPDGYPFLETMEQLMKRWPQDIIDNPPTPFVEQLMHFNFSDKDERAMAAAFRDAELPFKVYDVPDLIEAGEKWTDRYISENFEGGGSWFGSTKTPRSNGNCQESHDNFFAFFTPMGWQLGAMGPPPYRNNDWTFEKWAQHARYADATSLSFDRPHFYFQSGVPRDERYLSKDSWTFVSRDLPSFSSPTQTFFVFHPDDQKGIQCRFGERGVTAATHYDAGRNMVGMITGAKRYILSPPRECSKLGIVTSRGNTLFRHSLLNFGHINYLDTEEGSDMPQQERGWLERSKTAMAVETVLKAGEVLYIPSHWFHYITSLQKSAQCNVRSGVDEIGTRAFGGAKDVYDCKD